MRITGGDRGTTVFDLEPQQCIENWKRGDKYTLDTRRLTHLRLWIEDDDILDLFYSLIERYEKSATTAKKIDVCAEAMSRLAKCVKSATHSTLVGSINRGTEELADNILLKTEVGLNNE